MIDQSPFCLAPHFSVNWSEYHDPRGICRDRDVRAAANIFLEKLIADSIVNIPRLCADIDKDCLG